MDAGGTTGPTAPNGRVLCLVRDPDLRAEVVAVCTAVGAEIDTVDPARAADEGYDGIRPAAAVTGEEPGRPGARPRGPSVRQWATAALVLLDAPGPAPVDVTSMPRRDGVVLVHADRGPVDGAARTGDAPGPDVWRAAVAVGAEHVVVLPEARGWLSDRVRRACRPRGRCVAVVGARGGAGATSTAVALATAAAEAGLRVVLLDADPLGGGLELALGAEELPGLRWDGLADVRGPLPPGGLAASLPVADDVVLLSYGRPGAGVDVDAARAVLAAALDEHDLVVVDLPRSGDPAADALALRADVLLCVCPAELRASAAAPSVLARLPSSAAVHLLVRGPAPGGLAAADAAGAVREGLRAVDGRDVVHAGTVRPEPRLAAALERGEAFAVGARSPLRRWAARWVAAHVPAVGGPGRDRRAA